MNDDAIEQHLRELPAPALPEAWRKSILAASRREIAPSERARATWPAIFVYLRHLFVRNPITAGGLAAIWLLILVLKSGTPAEPMSDRLLAREDSVPSGTIFPRLEETQLAALLEDESEPQPVQRP